ncbi:MAG: sensor histidine kinase KdpD [Steroidobacteraceae bacterium]
MSGEPARPDPDLLLAAVERDAVRAQRGKLRIFFGASAGVGKTYAMLEAARAVRQRGVDMVAGYVEPHGRVETERLLDGLERLPFLMIEHAGSVRREFDLDAALQRRATITLVDELAHSNIEGGVPRQRHAKRWQDVAELLEAGLDVWTTLNVQHLESLNDVVAGITGVRQAETLPDHVFDEADEVELIDLPPDDLLDRLRAGKIYLPDQASRAMERFFRKSNLIALRELALRRTADRVDAAAVEYAGREPAARPWLARDRFLVAVAPDEQGESLVRLGKRFADALDAQWTVVSVETPAMQRLGEAARNRRIDMLRLAESLGAETVTLDGPTPARAILEYAQLRNVARIVVGEGRRAGLASWLRASTPEALLRGSHGIDISVIARRTTPAADRRRARMDDAEPAPLAWGRYGWGAGIAALCTGVCALMAPHFELTNLVMVYLLGAAFAGLRLGRGPAVLTVILSVAALDFCFVLPRWTFAISDAQYLVTFLVMLVVALTIATLTASVRQQNRVAGARERRTAMLYAMSRELAAATDRDAMERIAVRHVAETFSGSVALLMPDVAGVLVAPAPTLDVTRYAGADLSVAQWVHDHGRAAGLGADSLPGAAAAYLPLVGSRRTLGVLAVLPVNRRRVLLPEQRHLLETFAGQIALAVERALLADAAEQAKVAAHTEALRNTLLASISHDLRTPLAVITTAGTTLADASLDLDAAARAQLLSSIVNRARDMNDLISNVLDLMRFESGAVALRRDWQSLEELVNLAYQRLQDQFQHRQLRTALPDDLPAVHVDAALVTQLFGNLFDNALRHAPQAGTIVVAAIAEGTMVRVSVDDDGPGLPPGDTERLFAKFQRGSKEGSVPGAGLGLAICRAIVEAHGGTIHAATRPGGGARFEFTLPLQPPA